MWKKRSLLGGLSSWPPIEVLEDTTWQSSDSRYRHDGLHQLNLNEKKVQSLSPIRGSTTQFSLRCNTMSPQGGGFMTKTFGRIARPGSLGDGFLRGDKHAERR